MSKLNVTARLGSVHARKCARKFLIPFALLFAVLGLGSCGGGSSTTTPPPTGNFSNASLTGQYAFSVFGVDGVTGAYYGAIGSFAADGDGNITGGLADVLDLSNSGSAVEVAIASGTYQIQANGRGQITMLYSTGAPFSELQVSAALQSGSQGLLVETDLNASATGNFYQQTPSQFSMAALSGKYVFDVNGVAFTTNTVANLSIIGQFAGDGNGNITGGTVDENNGNVAAASGPLSLAPTAYALDSSGNGTNFGRGTLALDGRTFVFYIVDGTRVKLLEEDTLGGASGDATLQAANIPSENSGFTGSFVYLIGGQTPRGSQSHPITRVARFTADGAGNLGAISLDDNNNGSYSHLSQGSNISKATYSIDTAHAGSGRGTATFTDSSLGTYTLVFYLSSATTGVIQDTSLGLISDGPIHAQAAGPFTVSASAANYLFTWSGVQLGSSTAVPYDENFVGVYTESSATSNNITGLVDFVELGLTPISPSLDVVINGTLGVSGDGTANNPYRIAVESSPSTTFNFQAYFVDQNTLYLVCSDSARTSAGIVLLQPQ